MNTKYKSIKAKEKFNYVVKLNEKQTEVEILRLGTWMHPIYGEFTITEDIMNEMIKNFKENVRGIDISIDLDHGETNHGTEAVGWIKDIKKIGSRLMAEISWTNFGLEKLKDESYRYFSPEFKFDYTDEETGEQYSNVILGGSLTNRPFIKNMNPVMLSENIYTSYLNIQKEGKLSMNKKLLKILKLSEDSTDEQVQLSVQDVVTQLAETVEKLKEMTTEKEELAEDNKKVTSEKEAALAEKEELIKNAEKNKSDEEKDEDAKKKLAEESEEIKKKMAEKDEENKQLSEKVKTIETRLLHADWEKVASVALSEGKLTKPMLTQFEKQYKTNPKATTDLLEVMQPVVNLSEQGSSQENKNSNIKLFEQEVEKYQKENKCSYEIALSETEKNNPQLFTLFDNERRGL